MIKTEKPLAIIPRYQNENSDAENKVLLVRKL